jgi:hypothetical protein
VLDVDDGGDKTLLELEATHEKLPDTITAVTGSGGKHHVFKFPQGMIIPNKIKFAPGLDTCSNGGLIVASPSAHISGNRYKWLGEYSPFVKLNKADSNIAAKIDEGSRNSTLTSLAGTMRARGMTESWEYYDLEGAEQTHYQVQISDTSDFSIIIHDSYAQASGDTSYISPPLEENIWYWRVRVRDGLRWSEWAQSNFAVDLPPRGSILINEGNEATNSESVILTLPAEDMLGVADMCLSNDGVTWSSWLPYSNTLSWILADPTYDGIKYVFVVYRDTTGHESIPF